MTQPIVDIPGWLKLIMALATVIYGIVLGVWLNTSSLLQSKLWLEPLAFVITMVGPATWIAWAWSRSHPRTRVWGWALGFGMSSLLVVMLCVVFLRI